jgi:hypothetical protein
VRYVSVTFFDDVPDVDCDGELEHAARSSTLAAAAAARHRRYIVGLSGGAQMKASVRAFASAATPEITLSRELQYGFPTACKVLLW